MHYNWHPVIHLTTGSLKWQDLEFGPTTQYLSIAYEVRVVVLFYPDWPNVLLNNYSHEILCKCLCYFVELQLDVEVSYT